MKIPAVSIRTLIVIVLVIALDCYLMRNGLLDQSSFLYKGWPRWFHVGFFGYESLPVWFRAGFTGSLPMANTVVVGGALLLPGRKGARPFLTGFVLSGASAIFAFLALTLVLPGDGFTTINHSVFDMWLNLFIRHKGVIGLYQNEYFLATELLLYTVLFTIPELLIGVAGGLLARRFSRNDRVIGGPRENVGTRESNRPTERAGP